ncbi:MAG: putative Intracellular exo-alpha-L-arabinofuranosidase [Promethearchaeota archaeon]|jgi:alpha-N-arabinofuranosidase|nr:MAG: putative Intracellular exo-alpha-L-arabinofuranosidase [Candidatus Lokiarchaeota archaeon]
MVEIKNAITINVNSKSKPIDPRIYGNFIEHIGDCIHNGLWTYDPVNVPLVDENPFLSRVRKDVLKAVKDLKPTILRAFGGCYSDVYHWKDAIGPRDKRKIVKNLHWGAGDFETIEGLGPLIKNQFGTDEFLTFCEEIGAEPYLNVNYGSGTPQEAAEWVEYCNGSTDYEYGALRAEYGRSDPYEVKIWGVANEIYANWEMGYESSPKDYALKYLEFAKEMRKKDPSIELVAVGCDNSEWNQTLLRNLGEDWVNYVSIHRYLPNTAGASAGRKRRDNEKSYHALMASTPLIENYIKDTWRDITAALGEDTNVRIALDEWGLWYLITDVIRTNYNLQDGLWTALTLMIFQRMSDICPIANWAQLINCLGTIQTDPDGLILTPVYLVFKLFVDHMERNLLEQITVSCPTFSSKTFKSIPSRGDVPYIECNATIDDSREHLSIVFVNKHYLDSLTTILKLEGFTPQKEAVLLELTSESPFDYNTIENRNKVKINGRTIKDVDSKITMQLSAHSISILKLKKA